MTLLETLIRQADEAATGRGHVLGDWERGERYANAECMLCPCEVQVLAKPMANEIDVGGSAVAIDCA